MVRSLHESTGWFMCGLRGMGRAGTAVNGRDGRPLFVIQAEQCGYGCHRRIVVDGHIFSRQLGAVEGSVKPSPFRERIPQRAPPRETLPTRA